MRRGVLRWLARRRLARRMRVWRGGPGDEARYAAREFAKFIGLAFLVSVGIALGLTALALSGLEGGTASARRALVIYFSMLTIGALAASFLLTYALGGVMILRPYFALRRTEARMRARADAARRLALVAEHASDMVLILDASGLIEWANPAFYRAMGFAPAEVLGRPPDEVLKGARSDGETVARLRKAMDLRREETAELFAEDASGAARMLDLRLTPAEGRTGRLCFIAVMRDITERHEAQQRLSDAVNLLDDAFTLFDRDDRLMVFNEAYRTLVRAGPGELRAGMPLAELGVILQRAGLADFRGGTAEDWARRISADLRSRRSDEVFHSPDGAVHMFRSAVLATGELASLRIDVTELQAARLKAEEATRVKSRFLANISHEVRTPLNGVIAMAELLLESDLTENQRAGLELIARSGDALLTMLNDILDFSKIEEGKMRLNAAPFPPEEAFGDVAALMAPQARRKGLDFSYMSDSAGAGGVSVVGDVGRLRQIAANLVGNAVKFTSTGRVVMRCALRPSPGGMAISLEVEDTGAGISPESLETIFQPFDQGESLDAALMQEGTGLGLSISRQLAALMGGEITAESTPGRGSTFRLVVTLPTAPAAPVAADDVKTTDWPDWPAEEGASPVVLAVEDNPTNAAILTAMLRDAPLRLELCETGAEALTLFDRLRPALVLMDLHLPDMGGCAAAEAMRRRESRRGWPRTPIIAATASGREDTDAERRKAGMDDFVAKPFSKERLIGKIHFWLSAAPRSWADTG